jgi:hypothetical protein
VRNTSAMVRGEAGGHSSLTRASGTSAWQGRPRGQ